MRGLLPLLLAAACAGDADRPVILAAASLARALPEALSAAGGRADLRFAATSTLARQVERGLRADLLVTADRRWADHLLERDRAREARPLLSNALVCIARPAAPAPRGREDLRSFERIAVGRPEVPVGRYARRAVEGLGVATHLIPCRDAPAVVNAVRMGEADAGICYETDVRGVDGVRVLFRFDREDDPRVRYFALLLRDTRRARRLLSALRDERARSVFRRHGFGAP